MASKPNYPKLKALLQRMVDDMANVYDMKPITIVIGTGIILNGRSSSRSIGVALYRKREMYIDQRLTPEQMMDTLKHEFAHFMSHDFDNVTGHGWVWRGNAKRLGAEVSATCKGWAFRDEATW